MSELPAKGTRVTWAEAPGPDIGVVKFVQTAEGKMSIGVRWKSIGILWFSPEEFKSKLVVVKGKSGVGFDDPALPL